MCMCVYKTESLYCIPETNRTSQTAPLKVVFFFNENLKKKTGFQIVMRPVKEPRVTPM